MTKDEIALDRLKYATRGAYVGVFIGVIVTTVVFYIIKGG
jgi:hypothetical protein